MSSFLGKYDQPVTLYVDRELRRAQHQAERENWIAEASKVVGGDVVPPSDAAIAQWDADHPWVEEVEGDAEWEVRYRRCLTVHQRDWLRKMFAEQVEVGPGRYRYVITKPFDNAREATLMAILDWNLTGPDGPLPVKDKDGNPHDPEKELATKPPTPSALRVSWELLPPHIADLIQGVIVDTDAEPAPAEDKRFPAGGGSSDPVQLQPSPNDHEGVVGEGVVA